MGWQGKVLLEGLYKKHRHWPLVYYLGEISLPLSYFCLTVNKEMCKSYEVLNSLLLLLLLYSMIKSKDNTEIESKIAFDSILVF